MNSGARVAIGVAAGYLLGRTRKMRLALMIAGAGITGARGVSPSALLKRGMSVLSSVPEVAELAETAKSELLGAAKAATVAAATKRVESLSGRLQDQVRSRQDEDTEEDTDETEPETDEADQADDADEPDEPGEDEKPRQRRVSARAESSSGRSPVRRSRR